MIAVTTQGACGSGDNHKGGMQKIRRRVIHEERKGPLEGPVWQRLSLVLLRLPPTLQPAPGLRDTC